MIRNLRGVAAIAASVRSTSPHRGCSLFPAPSLANAPTVLPAEGRARVERPSSISGANFSSSAQIRFGLQTPLAANVSGGTQMQMSSPRAPSAALFESDRLTFERLESLRLPTASVTAPVWKRFCRMREHRRAAYHLHPGIRLRQQRRRHHGENRAASPLPCKKWKPCPLFPQRLR